MSQEWTLPPDDLLDQIAQVRDGYAKKQREALDQLEFVAAQGDAKEASIASTEAERHGAALLACSRVLKLVTDFRASAPLSSQEPR